jgi:phage gp29-like protein
MPEGRSANTVSAASQAPAAGRLTAEPLRVPPYALAAAAEPARFSPGQQDVEDLVDATLADPAADAPLPAAVLRRVIAAATDPADLERRLAALYQDHDRAAFTTLVERALFAADVLGYVNAETGRD